MAGKSNTEGRKGSDLFIVDNSDDLWRVEEYLREWTGIANKFDIATGYFEIGALLALDQSWQQLNQIRILMGDEVSRRTRQALLEGITKIKTILDESIEFEKLDNDFLEGVPAIVDAIGSEQIKCRVYKDKKFHAKAYITHGKHDVVGSVALVGSSNFTKPGLSRNVELNIQINREVDQLQEWFEKHWNEAEDIAPELLRVIDRHTREYSPFQVYAKALQEFFKAHELTENEWESSQSAMYKVLDQYQREGYHSLLKIAKKHKGSFLCDGVGLGKTFVGLMLIERLIQYDRKRVALFVPKSVRKTWERELKKYLPHLFGDFSNLAIFNHTDLHRVGEFPERLEKIRSQADVVIIDEAHHFRNTGTKGTGKKDRSRYWRMMDLCEGKELFFLTATPINNRLLDLQRMIELFTQTQNSFFSKIGINSLKGHFRKLEKELNDHFEITNNSNSLITNTKEAEYVLSDDLLFRELVIQRSRSYIKESQKKHGGRIVQFPKKSDPVVAEYSIKKSYGRLLNLFEKAFSRREPLFSLAIYRPLNFFKGEVQDAMELGRQSQVVGLIRTIFLKRFESSSKAFEQSCENMLHKLLAFLELNAITPEEKSQLKTWMDDNIDILKEAEKNQIELFGGEESSDEEDLIPAELLDNFEELSRDEYEVEKIIKATYSDLDQLIVFLSELKTTSPKNDNKLQTLYNLLMTDKDLINNKVIIFTEFLTTARYLFFHLKRMGITDIDVVDSMDNRDRDEVIKQFSPYYNYSSKDEIANSGKKEIKVLIATDVLAEGLNLQDCAHLINYDIHWNPVRLMQRIGRIDRRMNPQIEEKIITDHPGMKKSRGKIHFWNFLPPDELNAILSLYNRVTNKTLIISKIFGIEGKKLLTPDDDYDALKVFNQEYEGTQTPIEKIHLEYQELLKNDPELEEKLSNYPSKIFSGKESDIIKSKKVFFCYAIPGMESSKSDKDENEWTFEAGITKWYLYDVDSGDIAEEPTIINDLIASTPDTPRVLNISRESLIEIRKSMDKHIKNTYLKSVQAPIGVKPKLTAWMEIW